MIDDGFDGHRVTLPPAMVPARTPPLIARRTLVGGAVGAAAVTTLSAFAVPAPAAALPDSPCADAAPWRLRMDFAATPGQPWSMRLTDPHGASVLATHGAGLSVVTAGGRATATTVVSASHHGRSFTATLATDQPGVGIEVTATRGTDWVCSLTATAHGAEASHVAIDFAASGSERFLGMGERSNAVDQRGNEVLNRVLDGPYTPKQAAVQPYVPAPGWDLRPDATYFPVPWVLSTRGVGVLLDNRADSTFAFATPHHPDSWRAEAAAARLDLRVFPGPGPADALRRMTAAIGRQPAVRAPFVLGAWWQPVSDIEAATELAAQRAAGVPVSVAQTYAHYLPLGDQNPAEEQARTAALHAGGVAVTTYVNPMVAVGNPIYSAGRQSSAFTLNADGTPLVYHYSTAAAFTVSQIDFTSAAGRNLFDGVLDSTRRDGYDGWMEDFGEYTPDAALASDGSTGSALHNGYVVGYHATARAYADAADKPLVRFNRSGWTGAIPASDIVWGGDPSTLWGFDGLQSAVRQGLSMGLSGVSTWGSDIGGFFTWPDDGLTPELLNRWIAFGAFSGVMRLQSGGIDFGPPRAQVTDPAVAPVWKRYTQLRTRLHPYLAGSNDAYQATGMPVMRHLALAHPDDTVATGLDDEYLFGADLLVAPVVTQGATHRAVYLPEGEWVDLWATVSMADDGAVTLGAATLRRGGGTADVAAPIAQIPTHVRAGAVIPLLPSDVDTLADYGAEHLVTLRQRQDVRELLAFPASGNWLGTLGAGETIRSTTTAAGWTLRLNAVRSRTYSVQASLAAMPAHFTPASVRVDGKTVAFSHDATTRVLRFTARITAHGHVEVRG